MNDPRFFKLFDDNTLETLNLAQRISVPAPSHKENEAWSGMEILEHICLTDQLVGNFIFGPPDGITEVQFLVGENKLRQMLVQDNQRMDAPDYVMPRGTINNQEEFSEIFNSIRSKLKERLKIPNQLPDYRYYYTPLMGNLTVHDWLFFIIFHTERHLNQIRKVIASNKYI